MVDGLEAAGRAGGGPAGLAGGPGLNLFPFPKPPGGPAGRGAGGLAGPGLNGLGLPDPNGLPGTELGPFDKVAEEKPGEMTETTSSCTGLGGGGGLAVKGLAVVWAMLETKEEPPGELPNCLGLLGSLPAMGLKPNWS